MKPTPVEVDRAFAAGVKFGFAEADRAFNAGCILGLLTGVALGLLSWLILAKILSDTSRYPERPRAAFNTGF